MQEKKTPHTRTSKHKPLVTQEAQKISMRISRVLKQYRNFHTRKNILQLS